MHTSLLNTPRIGISASQMIEKLQLHFIFSGDHLTCIDTCTGAHHASSEYEKKLFFQSQMERFAHENAQWHVQLVVCKRRIACTWCIAWAWCSIACLAVALVAWWTTSMQNDGSQENQCRVHAHMCAKQLNTLEWNAVMKWWSCGAQETHLCILWEKRRKISCWRVSDPSIMLLHLQCHYITQLMQEYPAKNKAVHHAKFRHTNGWWK